MKNKTKKLIEHIKLVLRAVGDIVLMMIILAIGSYLSALVFKEFFFTPEDKLHELLVFISVFHHLFILNTILYVVYLSYLRVKSKK